MQKKLSLILLVVVFGTILIFAKNKGFFEGATNQTYKVTSPVSLFFSESSNKFSHFFSGIFSLSKLQKENATLKDQLNALQAEVAQLSEAKKENEKLRNDLGFKVTNNFTYQATEVIAFDPSALRGTVVINKGVKDGLKPGMAAIAEGFLVGKIIEVSENTSKVQLITDPASAIPVTLKGINTNGIAKGEIGFGLTMEKIPQGEQIKTGDLVISSGLGGELPKGLILGTVEKVESQENSLFVTAEVRPSADLRNLYRLIIIKG